MKIKGSELKYPTTSDCVGISNSTCWKEIQEQKSTKTKQKFVLAFLS